MSVALAPALESYNSMAEIFEVPGLELSQDSNLGLLGEKHEWSLKHYCQMLMNSVSFLVIEHLLLPVEGEQRDRGDPADEGDRRHLGFKVCTRHRLWGVTYFHLRRIPSIVAGIFIQDLGKLASLLSAS